MVARAYTFYDLEMVDFNKRQEAVLEVMAKDAKVFVGSDEKGQALEK